MEGAEVTYDVHRPYGVEFRNLLFPTSFALPGRRDRRDHRASGSPTRKATKQATKTDQSRDAPKYRQSAVCGPGYPAESQSSDISAIPNTLATRVNTPTTRPRPIISSPYAVKNAHICACGKMIPSRMGFIQGYVPWIMKLRIHCSNPPCMVKSVPKTLYWPNSRKKQPTTIRNVARAVALRFDSTVISIIRQSQRRRIDEPNTNVSFPRNCTFSPQSRSWPALRFLA